MDARSEAARLAADEDLVARLAAGDEAALRTLHRRYAPLLFAVAARVVDAAEAEEIVQDVFLTLWRKNATFDPARGSLKGWLCQIARRRALNALRGRRPEFAGALPPEDEIADASLEPDEALWEAHRRSALRAAVDALPAAQRRALSLAYFDELTHEQVAAVLRLPLGTAKTRIRLAIRRIAPLVAAVAGVSLLVVLWRRETARQATAAKEEGALRMVTASDVVVLHLYAAPGVPPETHGNLRARRGVAIAVLTASHLGPPPAGSTYEAWVRRGATWSFLGTLERRADGSGLLILESPAIAEGLDEAQLRLTGGAVVMGSR